LPTGAAAALPDQAVNSKIWKPIVPIYLILFISLTLQNQRGNSFSLVVIDYNNTFYQ
jgi:hypothetical protein